MRTEDTKGRLHDAFWQTVQDATQEAEFALDTAEDLIRAGRDGRASERGWISLADMWLERHTRNRSEVAR